MGGWEEGVSMALAADEESSTLGHGVGDEGFEAGEGGWGDHGADVDVGFVEGGADAEGADAWFEEGYEGGVGVWEGDDALDADAILAGGLEDAAHEEGRYAG